MKLQLVSHSNHFDAATGNRHVVVTMQAEDGTTKEFTVAPEKYDYINLVRVVDSEFVEGEEVSQPIAAPVGAVDQSEGTPTPPEEEQEPTAPSDAPAAPESAITIEGDEPAV